MSAPRRIQLKRTKGWRLPEGTINVARPGRYGNPYRIGQLHQRQDDHNNWTLGKLTRHEAVELFRQDIEAALSGGTIDLRVVEMLAELRGHDVACWCGENEECHGDVWLEVANR